VIDAETELPPLAKDWNEVALEDGRTYYYNTRTKETTWDRPTQDDDEADTAPLPENWVQRRNERTGETFYFNVSTHVTSTERPRERERVPIQTKKVRDNIFTPAVPTEGWVPPTKVPKSVASRRVIERALKAGFLFSQLKSSDLDALIDTMTPVHVAPGEDVITQGEQGDVFYVVESGTFDIVLQDHGTVRPVTRQQFLLLFVCFIYVPACSAPCGGLMRMCMCALCVRGVHPWVRDTDMETCDV